MQCRTHRNVEVDLAGDRTWLFVAPPSPRGDSQVLSVPLKPLILAKHFPNFQEFTPEQEAWMDFTDVAFFSISTARLGGMVFFQGRALRVVSASDRRD